MDEVRISNLARGARWFRYSADNQKPSSTFTSASLEYTLLPQLPSELNATVAVGSAFRYLVPAVPPANSYSAAGLPAWATINSVTGEITGTPIAAGEFNATITATNAKGDANATLRLLSSAATVPSILAATAKATADVPQPSGA